MANVNPQYLRSYKHSVGLGLNSAEYGETTITDAILNGISQ